MLIKWWRQPARGNTIETIYGAIVAQAREPVFYAQYGVPDTIEGRFDMLVLHLFLYLRRISAPGVQGRVGQPLFDRFCTDLDDNLREIGVGDFSVPKKMQKFGRAFFGRSAAYEKALVDNDRDAAALALARNVFRRETITPGVLLLADYMFEAAQALREADDAQLAHGQFAFPVPPQVIPEGGSRNDRERDAERQ